MPLDPPERIAVFLANLQAERMRQAIRDFESALAKTRDRIEQSKRRIVNNDKLIARLSQIVFGSSNGDESSPGAMTLRQ